MRRVLEERRGVQGKLMRRRCGDEIATIWHSQGIAKSGCSWKSEVLYPQIKHISLQNNEIVLYLVASDLLAQRTDTRAAIPQRSHTSR